MTSNRNISRPTPGQMAEGSGTVGLRRMPGHGRRVLVIYNPAAGFRRRRRFNLALRRLATLGCPLTVRETAGPGEAERLALGARSEECDVVVAAGGDGTINEIANALAGSGMPMGIIPLGTANVLASEIGVGADPVLAADTIAFGHPGDVFLGRAGDRRFCAMAGVGLDARIVARISLRLKRLVGKGAYAWGCLRELAARPGTVYRIEVNGETKRAAWAIVANAHYYAGRFVAAPEARLDLPTLHLVLMKRPGRWNLLRYGTAFLLDRLQELDDVETIPARTMRIDAPEGEPLQADGDLIGRLPAEISVADERLTLLFPPV